MRIRFKVIQLTVLFAVSFLLVSTTAAFASYQGQNIPFTYNNNLYGVEGFYTKTPDGSIYLFPVNRPQKFNFNTRCFNPAAPGIYRPKLYPDLPCKNHVEIRKP